MKTLSEKNLPPKKRGRPAAERQQQQQPQQPAPAQQPQAPEQQPQLPAPAPAQKQQPLARRTNATAHGMASSPATSAKQTTAKSPSASSRTSVAVDSSGAAARTASDPPAYSTRSRTGTPAYATSSARERLLGREAALAHIVKARARSRTSQAASSTALGISGVTAGNKMSGDISGASKSKTPEATGKNGTPGNKTSGDERNRSGDGAASKPKTLAKRSTAQGTSSEPAPAAERLNLGSEPAAEPKRRRNSKVD